MSRFKYIEISTDVPSTEVPALDAIHGVEREVGYAVAGTGGVDASAAPVLLFTTVAGLDSQRPTVTAGGAGDDTAALFVGVALSPSVASEGEALVFLKSGTFTSTAHGLTAGTTVTIENGAFVSVTAATEEVVAIVVDANTLRLV